MGDNMKLYIPRDIHNQIMFWVNKSQFEVSWFGTLYYDEKHNHFVVQKVFLLKQKNHSSETEIDGAALADLLYDTKDEPYELRWWGHSHVKMSCFWSNTDRTTMKQLSNEGWFLSTVFNQKNELKTAFDMRIKDNVPVFIDNIETQIFDYVTDEKEKIWDKEYKEKVINQTYSSPAYTGKISVRHHGAKSYKDYDSWDEYMQDKNKIQKEMEVKQLTTLQENVSKTESDPEKPFYKRDWSDLSDKEWDEYCSLYNKNKTEKKDDEDDVLKKKTSSIKATEEHLACYIESQKNVSSEVDFYEEFEKYGSYGDHMIALQIQEAKEKLLQDKKDDDYSKIRPVQYEKKLLPLKEDSPLGKRIQASRNKREVKS